MGSDDDDADVVAFIPRAAKDDLRDGVIVDRVMKRRYHCQHNNQLELDEARRIVKCKDCGECFEPFDWMWTEAQRRQAWKFDSLKRVTQEIEEKKAELENLKNCITNAKAQLKRALAKQG